MAITNATLASAMAATDSVMVLSASTGVTAGYFLECDGEMFQVVSSYTIAGNGVNVPVIRALNGTVASAHPTSAKVRLAAGSDTAWGGNAPQTDTQYPIAGGALQKTSYSAAGAITLPTTGNDMLAYLNGTTILAMTVADPGTALDGSLLWIASNGAAAHTVTFATGLSGTGASGSYDVITVNATGPVLLGPFMAVNGFWQMAVAVPMAGTVSNITATVS